MISNKTAIFKLNVSDFDEYDINASVLFTITEMTLLAQRIGTIKKTRFCQEKNIKPGPDTVVLLVLTAKQKPDLH